MRYRPSTKYISAEGIETEMIALVQKRPEIIALRSMEINDMSEYRRFHANAPTLLIHPPLKQRVPHPVVPSSTRNFRLCFLLSWTVRSWLQVH